MEESRLTPEVEGRLAQLQGVELVVGVLSYQHARTIEGVLRGIEKGVETHFPEARALIVHSDAGSTDGTGEAVAQAAGLPMLRLRHRVSAGLRAAPPAQGVPGADEGFRTLCLVARVVGARAALLVGADLRVLPDEWVERLLRPVWLGELDFVAPLFPRHLLDGALTTCLLYPLTRALYGCAVRQVMAAEVALSGDLLARLADTPLWGTAATRALPLFLATSAAAMGARLGEAWLGVRDAETREGRLDLGSIMSDVVGGAFALAERYEEQWREARAGPPPRRLGEPPAEVTGAEAVSQARMIAVFRQGLRDLQPLWEQALTAQTLADLYPLGDLAPDEFRFSASLWARVVYDFQLAYRFRVLHREHLLRSLVPLYFGRMAALVGEAAGQPVAVHERLVERQARAFEDAKADVVDRWR